MAINFLSGLNIDGNIDLNSNQIKEVRIDNLSSAPTGSLGRIYYDDSTNKLRLYNGAWVDLTTGADGNTEYTLDVPAGTTSINLKGTDNTDVPIKITGGTNVTVVRTSSDEITINATDAALGTVTDVLGGTGITISGTSTVTPTVNIDYAGTDNAILAAGTTTITADDYLWFSAKADNNIYKTTLNNMPGFGKDGTVTSVDSGAGLTGGAITATGTISVQYAGTDNIILDGADGSLISVAAADKVLISDATDNNAKYVSISQLTTAVGGGTVTSVDGSGGSTGLTLTGGAITTSGTLTLGGTLNEVSGGTGQSTYTKGDILYSDAANSLVKLGIGSQNQVLKVNSSGVPAWTADSNAGGTVTSITPAADSGSGTAITTSGTLTLSSSSALITTSVSGTTWKISTTATNNVGTVTSVTASKGAKVTGTATTVPNVEVDYSATGIIANAAGHSGYAEGDDKILLSDDSASGIVVEASLIDIPINVLGSPEADLSINSKKLTSVATGTAGTDGVNLGQVQSLVAGVGVFQGGYDASANSPAIAGASNIALTTGDFFVVTKDGTIAFNGSNVDVEVGDMIYANTTIAASTNPAASDYAIVIQDANIAGVGGTDAATEKGVAGFSSASFAGTANGFITVKAGGISDAQLASTFNKQIGTSTNLDTANVDVVDQINVTDGVITSMSKRTLPNAAVGSVGVTEIATQAEVDAGTDTFRYVTPATLASAQSKRSYTGTYPATNTNTFSIATGVHGLANGPWIIQTYDTKGAQVYMDVLADQATGTVTFTAKSNLGANGITVVMQIVG